MPLLNLIQKRLNINYYQLAPVGYLNTTFKTSQIILIIKPLITRGTYNLRNLITCTQRISLQIIKNGYFVVV